MTLPKTLGSGRDLTHTGLASNMYPDGLIVNLPENTKAGLEFQIDDIVPLISITVGFSRR
jgi:hypothetical protein